MNLPDRVSYSSWQSYRKGCQWRWKLDVVDAKKSVNYGIYMDFGSCIHKAVEKYKTRKDALTKEQASVYFEQEYRKLHAENLDKYREKDRKLKVDDFVASGIKILDHLERCKELWDAEVVYNEHELILPIDRSDGTQMNFKGYIDMVIKTKDKKGKDILYVIDFKTCSWGWDFKKKTDRELQYQLFLYKHFLSKKFNLDPKCVKTAFILLKRTPSKTADAIEFFPVNAGPAAVQQALDELNSDITDMKVRLESDTLIKNRKICKNDFGDVCPYFNTEHCQGE